LDRLHLEDLVSGLGDVTGAGVFLFSFSEMDQKRVDRPVFSRDSSLLMLFGIESKGAAPQLLQ
jgi:hypothetical protein